MKPTGIVRPIDSLGRIVIPTELRKTLHIKDKDPLEIFVDNNCIILKKYQPACIFCSSMEEVEIYKGQRTDFTREMKPKERDHKDPALFYYSMHYAIIPLLPYDTSLQGRSGHAP